MDQKSHHKFSLTTVIFNNKSTAPHNTQKEVDVYHQQKNLGFICPSIQLLNRHHLARDLTQKNVVRRLKKRELAGESLTSTL